MSMSIESNKAERPVKEVANVVRGQGLPNGTSPPWGARTGSQGSDTPGIPYSTPYISTITSVPG